MASNGLGGEIGSCEQPQDVRGEPDLAPARVLPDQVVELVAERIKAHGVAGLVVDPVLLSTSGHALSDSAAARAMVARLGSCQPALLHTPCMQRCRQWHAPGH